MIERVVINSGQRDYYIGLGYRDSDSSPESLIGNSWSLIPEPDRDELVVVEIDAAKKAALNELPPAYIVEYGTESLFCYARVSKVGVQERGEWQSYVAGSEGTREVDTSRLFENARSAALGNKELILDQISKHRNAIAELEAFLARNEAL